MDETIRRILTDYSSEYTGWPEAEAAGIKFTHWPKTRFIAAVVPIHTKHGMTLGSAFLRKISVKSAHGVGMRRPKYEKLHLVFERDWSFRCTT